MYNIAIIGAGQLGSRHLQGLTLAKLPMRLFVVDNLVAALDLTRVRYEEMPCNKHIESITYLTSIESLPSELDMVIVATGSKSRSHLLVDLLSKKEVKYLVLEKVLFPDLGSYETITVLLNRKGLGEKTWINCPRRMFDGYKKLQTEFRGVKQIRYEKTGSDWGLGCNAIHFIDHYAFLSGDMAIQPFNLSGLDHRILESKRAGYVEFTGVITGLTDSGNEIRLASLSEQNQPDVLAITADGIHYDINETTDQILKEGKLWAPIGIKYQSSLTGEIAEQILLQGTCELTRYAESTVLHLAFLRPLVAFYNSLTKQKGDSCPIT